MDFYEQYSYKLGPAELSESEYIEYELNMSPARYYMQQDICNTVRNLRDKLKGLSEKATKKTTCDVV